MPLTPAQLAMLKADIAANSDLNSKPNTPDGSAAIADLYNAVAAPVFIVWKKNVSIGAVGDAINATELAGLTTLNVTRLQAIGQYAPSGINPSLADRRQAFDDIFSGAGGATTRASLLALWKRNATRGEKLFATGTGSDASPATSAFATDNFPITLGDVQAARALP